MAQPTQPPAPAGNHVHLLVASSASAVVGTALALDVVLPTLGIPMPLTNLGLVMCLGAWVIWYLARRLNRIDERLGDHTEAAAWAEGYVTGVARRTPPNERVRWMDD